MEGSRKRKLNMSEGDRALIMSGDNADHDDLECEDEEEEKGGEGEDEDPATVLPPEVRKRVKALKKIQVEITKIEAKFYEEMHELECKYLPMYLPHFEKRKIIVDGTYEPNEDECDFVGGSDSEELAENVAKMAVDENKEDAKEEKVPGIPEFWLTIFRNVEMLSEMTQVYDEPILKHLQDVKVEMIDKPMGFKLHFFFSHNEYFSNNILTKSYEMKCEIDQEDPFSFEGPEIIKCFGCPIDWHKGKNVTIKTVKKKQKHKQRGSIRTVSKTVEAPSFFNFFSPPQVPDDIDAEGLDEETQMRLTNDFEIGQYIRERIVPRAVLYFTGEALEEEFEEEEEDEEEDEEDEEKDEGAPKIRFNRKSGLSKGGAQRPAPQECKQQ